MAREKRTVRLEDWQGNQYVFTATGSSANGKIIDALDAEGGGDISTEGTISSTTMDANNGTAIILPTSATNQKKLISAAVDEINFGKVTISARVKFNGALNDSTEYLTIQCYYIAEDGSAVRCSIHRVTGAMIGTSNAGKWIDLQFTTDFAGTYYDGMKLRIDLYTRPVSGITAYFDQLTIQKSFAAVVAIPQSAN